MQTLRRSFLLSTNYLIGKKAVCYHGFENELKGATITDDGVVTDENITTARGMGYALDFAKEILTLSIGKERSEELIFSLYGRK